MSFTKQDLLSLNYTYKGLPFVRIVASALDVSDKTEILYEGLPFYLISAVPSNVYVKSGGSWRRATKIYVKDIVWRSAETTVYASEDFTWKSS
jgi:hypothetical protein